MRPCHRDHSITRHFCLSIFHNKTPTWLELAVRIPFKISLCEIKLKGQKYAFVPPPVSPISQRDYITKNTSLRTHGSHTVEVWHCLMNTRPIEEPIPASWAVLCPRPSLRLSVSVAQRPRAWRHHKPQTDTVWRDRETGRASYAETRHQLALIGDTVEEILPLRAQSPFTLNFFTSLFLSHLSQTVFHTLSFCFYSVPPLSLNLPCDLPWSSPCLICSPFPFISSLSGRHFLWTGALIVFRSAEMKRWGGRGGIWCRG